jgi:hypothetical protein
MFKVEIRNGKADAVLMHTTPCEKYLKAGNMARLLARADQEVAGERTL